MANKTAKRRVLDIITNPYRELNNDDVIADEILLSLCDLIILDVCSSCKESVRKSLNVPPVP